MLLPQTVKPSAVRLSAAYSVIVAPCPGQLRLSSPLALPCAPHTPWAKVAALLPGAANLPLAAAQQLTIYF